METESKKETERIVRSDIWYEMFLNGEIWELQIVGNQLLGRKTYFDLSSFDDDCVVEGVSSLEEKAKLMGLKPAMVVD
jgi:hypothetical protein